MEKTFKSELERLRREYRFENWPSSRENYEGRWSMMDKVRTPRSAAETERFIVEFLDKSGHQGQKISTQGNIIQGEDYKNGAITIKGKVTRIPSGATLGAADITSSIYGLKVDWELKYSKGDKLSDRQKQFKSKVQKSGAMYFVITNIDHFFETYQQIMDYPQIQLMKQFHENK